MSSSVTNDEFENRRGLLFAAVGLLGAFSLLGKSQIAKASALGEENATLGLILNQIREGIKQAKELKKDYYDQHIKVAVDAYKETKDTAKSVLDTADTVRKEKEAIQKAVGSINEQAQLLLGRDEQVKLLSSILESLTGIEEKHVSLDKAYATISKDVTPEQQKTLRGKRRVFELIAQSRTQSVTSEQKIGEIYKREQKTIGKIESSSATKTDQIHASSVAKLGSISDKLDEMIRLQAKSNDLMEALLQYQTTRDIDSRYGDKGNIAETAKTRVQLAGSGKWGGDSSAKGASK
jgi:hypothetical protein